MFTEYDLKINLPDLPPIHEFKPLERPHLSDDHPFRRTSFWHRVKLYEDNRISVSYFLTPKNEEVLWHSDGKNIRITFNYLIKGTSPVVFKTGEKFHYKCAMFDVSKEHMVPASDEDRLLLKIVLFGRNYEDEKPRIDEALKGIKEIDYEDLLEILK